MNIITNLFRLLPILIGSLFFASCNIQKRLPNYLQNVADSSIVKQVSFPELTIQKNDMLSIRVYSASTNRDVSDEIYNLPSARGQGLMGAEASIASGFLVDINGEIDYPIIGRLQVVGMTRTQLEDVIKKRINEKDSVLADPKVMIRFQNLRVLVMGEVNQQGPINIPGERVTILEAIGLAGGTTDFAIRNKIKVMREVDGRREIGEVDITSNNLFASPYYSLKQNDVVVVDPIKRKIRRMEQAEVMRQVTFGVGIITTGLLIYNIFK